MSLILLLSPPWIPATQGHCLPGSSSGLGPAPILGQGKPLPSRWLPSILLSPREDMGKWLFFSYYTPVPTQVLIAAANHPSWVHTSFDELNRY